MSNWLSVLNSSLSHLTLWHCPSPEETGGSAGQPGHTPACVPQLLHASTSPCSPLVPSVPRSATPCQSGQAILVSRRLDRCPHNACLAAAAMGVPQRA